MHVLHYFSQDSHHFEIIRWCPSGDSSDKGDCPGADPDLVSLSSELEVGPLHNRVHGARLLAQAAVDALRHVNVVAGRAPTAVLALLRLNRDRLSRANLPPNQLLCNQYHCELYPPNVKHT